MCVLSVPEFLPFSVYGSEEINNLSKAVAWIMFVRSEKKAKLFILCMSKGRHQCHNVNTDKPIYK